jgi:hypothetical protein
MPDGASGFLTPWSNFYVIAGSSAAALTGLMFVVITLVRREEAMAADGDGIGTFSTPTVLHFSAALLVSATLCVPWHSLFFAGLPAALVGIAGLAYGLRVMTRAKRLKTYVPDAEDWISYTILPAVAYFALLGGFAMVPFPREALFAIAAGVLLLIFIGIHNAWDVVTFLATGGLDDKKDG